MRRAHGLQWALVDGDLVPERLEDDGHLLLELAHELEVRVDRLEQEGEDVHEVLRRRRAEHPWRNGAVVVVLGEVVDHAVDRRLHVLLVTDRPRVLLLPPATARCHTRTPAAAWQVRSAVWGGLRNHTGFPSPLCKPPLPRHPDPGLAQRRGLWPRRSGITCHPSTGPETACRRPGPSTGAWRQPATADRPTTHGCWRHPARPWPGCCDSTPGETPSWEAHTVRFSSNCAGAPQEGKGENHRTMNN